MIRSLAAAALVLAIASPSFGESPENMTCAQMMEKHGQQLIRNGQTLQKAGKAALDMGKWMKKSKEWRADGASRMRGGKSMVAMGKKMESDGKALTKESQSGKHAHTMKDAMMEMAKVPADVRAKWGADMKEIAAGFKLWSREMQKGAGKMEDMAKMMEAAAPAAAPAEPKKE